MISRILKGGSFARTFVQLGLANMPIDLVFVRHGASEGNKAFEEDRKGNRGFFTPEFTGTHESRWRLTRKGREQAIETGEWIRENISEYFGRYLVSEHVRALETAALLKLSHANWKRDIFLRERNFGILSSMNLLERKRYLEGSMAREERDGFYWTPPGGESLASLALRCDYILDSLAETQLHPSSAVIVTHKNVMQTMRMRVEMIRQINFERDIWNIDDYHKLKNGTIIHYTRRNPVTKEIEPVYRWVRFATPWLGGKYAKPKWDDIHYTFLTNDELAEDVERQERTTRSIEKS